MALEKYLSHSFLVLLWHIRVHGTPRQILHHSPMGKGLQQSKDFLHKDKDYANWKERRVGADGDTHMDDSGGNKRSADEAGLTDRPGRGQDGSGSGGQMVEAARAAGPGGNAPSKETPVSRYPSLTYGLQETHTTILPLRTYCSVKATNYEVPQKMEFRLNSIYDIIKHQVAAPPGGTTNAIGDNIYNCKLAGGAIVVNNTKTALFPSQLVAGADATERPFWRDYWANFYEYYTVLGCKYKITIVNTSTQSSAGAADMEFAYEMDSYSQAQGAAGNVMTVGPYHEVRGYKNVKWATAHAGTNINTNDYVTSIAGEYRPGMVKHNIINDGDIKTWTQISTNGGLPTNTDTLVILAFPGDMNTGVRPNGDSTTNSNGCMVRIELDYIVQF